ncbi:MaoC family dehydratase [Nocardia amikacinitolerans]|uniref:MaoC family dehydratase n=1 Tax=Nocardia amikacinitolerans TaxID=756689 RepID=UPI0020A4576C|nr:MaoC family dehydratase [Nocardia amikacinitolerans]MCP2288852.1 Acyl dehydratase [Nocardia amikacinitolerans]
MPLVFTSLDDLRAAVGEPIGPSAPLLVDQARIDAFAEVTGDRQWIHVDPVRAAHGPYGTTIAHGYLTLSLISHFRQELLEFDFGAARVNYGVNKVRFPAVLPAGSEVRATATVNGVTESAAGTSVTATYVLEAGAAKPVCVAETVVLITG